MSTTNNTMTKEQAIVMFQKMMDDKRAIRDCIRQSGDIKKLANERGIHFVTPI